MPEFVLGFAALANRLGQDTVGDPLQDQIQVDENYAVQMTTRGLLWFSQEANQAHFLPTTSEARQYRPEIFRDRGTTEGAFPSQPKGIVLHGTRGPGLPSTREQFDSTRGFATQTDLGWNATVGDDMVSIHFRADQWGFHARRASSHYIAFELAQPTKKDRISDAQVRAISWLIRAYVQPAWPNLKITVDNLPTHAEVENHGETGPNPDTGKLDGKDDVFPFEDVRADKLRARIAARLADRSWTV
jgi:hypothetical protein